MVAHRHQQSLIRAAMAIRVSARAPSIDLLDEVRTSFPPDGVDAEVVLDLFNIQRVMGVALLFARGFARGMLVPGYVERAVGNKVAVFYANPPWTGEPTMSVPDEHTSAQIAAGITNPSARRLVVGCEDLGALHAHMVARWKYGNPTAIALCVIGRMPDQVLETYNGAWLFHEEQ